MKRHRTTEAAASRGTVLTRRSLLKRAGCAAAAATFSRATWLFAQPEISPVMTRLSTYMAEAGNRALPEEVVERAKHHILDTFAAMISGSGLPAGRAAISFARAYGGEKVATVVGSNVVCGPIEAALTNGTLAHSDETDDVHPVTAHVGAPIIPPALALSEQFGNDGLHFLRAVVLGYDIGPRVTMTLHTAPVERETEGLVGGFGAAAAAACAAGLDARQMRSVLDYAAQQSTGLVGLIYRDTGHIEKGFVCGGGPARSGVTAALVVRSGWTGVDDILSGRNNFFTAYAPQADPEGLVDKLGERYEIMRTAIKKWTVGNPVQAPLDALDNMMKRHPFEADQVQQIVVRMSARGIFSVDNREMPDICLQHLVALMVVDKTVTFRTAHDNARMQDPAILRLRAKVQLLPDEELQRLMPRRPAIVEVTLADGTRLTERVDAVRGTAENPMTRDEIVAKSRELIQPVLGARACASLIEQTLALENVKDILELRPCLQTA